MNPFTFSTTKSIINEIGSLKNIAQHCQNLGISKPLIVTDIGIVNIGLLDSIKSPLKSAGIAFSTFSEVIADPPEQIVLDAVNLALKNQVDGIIGFGGGSSMDTAKLVALLSKSDEELSEIYGVDQVKGQRLPLILIPTTAGTGSEVTAVAIVTTGETTKAGVVSSTLLPDIALLDAELTTGLPPHITAATGVDAMVHAVEAYTSIHKKNPYSDMLAKEALKLMSQNIHTATHHGEDLDARQAMLFGACLAGQAFANAPVAAVHALAYPLGGHFHIPHGLSNSLVLPHVLSFNSLAAEKEYAELYDEITPDNQLTGKKQKTEALVEYFSTLAKDLGLPTTLREMDISEESLTTLASDAMLQQRLLINNPREVSEQDALEIYRAAY